MLIWTGVLVQVWILFVISVWRGMCDEQIAGQSHLDGNGVFGKNISVRYWQVYKDRPRQFV